MNGNITQILSNMARATGLNRETIKDLMKKGWYYEENGETATFKKPVKK